MTLIATQPEFLGILASPHEEGKCSCSRFTKGELGPSLLRRIGLLKIILNSCPSLTLAGSDVWDASVLIPPHFRCAIRAATESKLGCTSAVSREETGF